METPPHSQKFIKVFLLLITFLWITQTSLSIFALSPPPGHAASLSNTTVTLDLTSADIMGAVSFIIQYNQQVVIFESVSSSGSALGSMVMPNSKPEKGWVKIGLIKADGFTSGEVLKLTFSHTGSEIPNESTFQMFDLSVKDLSGRSVPTAQALLSISTP